ncbi:MAG TPA: recombinase family protein, partial [Myxococcota bacterium]|nr:recombinase family protein [Myxococcota bacterium]
MPRKPTPRRPNSRSSRAATEAARPPRRPCVAYARVSSKDQEREGFSIPAQQRLLQSYAENNGYEIIEEYVDVETAKRTGRTNYNRMISWLKRNKKTCNVILVEKTDRLYRNLKDWVDLDDIELEIHLVKEGVVLSDDARSADKFMHGIRVLMAKNYIDNLSEEATKGMREKAAQGIWPSRAALGYLNVRREDGKKVMEVDPVRGPLITRLFERASTGAASLSELTAFANEAGLRMKRTNAEVVRSTVHRILHNPIYVGDVVWEGRTTKGIHTPLVSRSIFERVQDVLDGRYQHQRDHERLHEWAFTGLVRCAHCGCALTAQRQKERYVYYHCTGAKGSCNEPYLREEVLAEHFARALRRLHFNDEVMTWLRTGLKESFGDTQRHHREAIERLEADCAKLQARIDAAYNDKLDGVIDAAFFERKANEWRAAQRELRRNIVRHEDANQTYMEEGVMLLSLGREAADLFAARPGSDQRRLLNFMVSNSYWGNGELKVEWREPFGLCEEFADAAKYGPPS